MEDCLFCKINNNLVDSKTLYEDDLVKVILDAYPNSDGHFLVIPKKHYESIYDVDNATLMHMFDIAKKYANLTRDKLNQNASTFLINYGESQVIKHLHLHVIDNIKGKAKLSTEEVYQKLMDN